ncbi:hypothetical protein PHMEG_00024352 [Phytophthora megakarya]|uniref:Uncharacterized protein n=1 Tax=Phytophthora megakarya TaxID=4795 RepID=A0A225VFX9_9STRA|nr:hypothetical protein PHMEG_00024352 [Phytophthora megakarya]
MEQCWGFIVPWCEILKHHIQNSDYEETEEYDWSKEALVLTVNISISDTEVENEINNFRQEFQRVQEAVALLAAMRHVDYNAFFYLLLKHCELWTDERYILQHPISSKFLLSVDKEEGNFELDLVRFCGTHLLMYPSKEYLSALSQIKALDTKQSGLSTVWIEIPVKLDFFFLGDESVSYGEILKRIAMAEKEIERQWKQYNDNAREKSLSIEDLRCKFVLEPMNLQLPDISWTAELAQTLTNLIDDNVWFSLLEVTFPIVRASGENEFVSRKSFGLFVRRIFDSTRRIKSSAHINYHFDGVRNSQPYQISDLCVICRGTIPAWDFEAMCSAMVLTQTTKKLTLELDIDEDDQTSREDWWKWLAYALFSKRARGYSSLETLNIDGIERLDTNEARAFISVLESEHPEELLFGTPRGVVDERDATLRSGSAIRWEFDDQGEPVVDSSHLIFEYPTQFIRTFSDDGTSEWVNVLVPGFGRCQVQRCNLEFTAAVTNGSGGLTSLSIGVIMMRREGMEGLLSFIASIGASLTTLTIRRMHRFDYSPWDGIDDNAIVRSCPNLRELKLSRELVEWQLDFIERAVIDLDFTEYRVAKISVPEFSFSWTDVPDLAQQLSDPNNPLAKCTRRLAVPLLSPEEHLQAGRSSEFEFYMNALVEMLKVNDRLEFLEVSSSFTQYFETFMKFNRKPIYRQRKPLSKKCTAAFLSIISTIEQNVDHSVLMNIFSFAAPSIFREVCDLLVPKVTLPRCNTEVENEITLFIRQEFQMVQEAVALLAVVGHIDYNAYDYLLSYHCKVWAVETRTLPVPFTLHVLLDVDKGRKRSSWKLEFDLVRFCGTHLQMSPSDEYLSALNQIAALDDTTEPSPVCIEIPVKLDFTRYPYELPYGKTLEGIAIAEKEIERQRKQ